MAPLWSSGSLIIWRRVWVPPAAGLWTCPSAVETRAFFGNRPSSFSSLRSSSLISIGCIPRNAQLESVADAAVRLVDDLRQRLDVALPSRRHARHERHVRHAGGADHVD